MDLDRNQFIRLTLGTPSLKREKDRRKKRADCKNGKNSRITTYFDGI